MEWPCAAIGCVRIAHRSFQRFRHTLRKTHCASIRAAAKERRRADGSAYPVTGERDAANGSTQVGARVCAATELKTGGAMRAENGDAAASSEWAGGAAVVLAATRCSTRPSAPRECAPIEPKP